MTRRNLWRHIPLDKLLVGNTSSMVRARLSLEGYHTAGDLIDATPGELAENIKGLGMVRAIKLRQRVIAQVCPPVFIQHVQRDDVVDTPIFSHTVLGIIGTLAFLFIIWAALVMVP